MSLGNINRTTNSYTPKETKSAQATQQTGGPKGKAAAAKAGSGDEKTEANQAVKDVANISTDISVGTATSVALFTGTAMVAGPIVGTVAVVALQGAVDKLPSAERMAQAAEKMAKAFIEALQQQ